MLQGGQCFPYPVQLAGLELGQDYAFPGRQASQYLPPGVDDHAVAMSFASIRMTPALAAGNDKTLIFNRACTQQDFPVRPAGGCGKSGRQQQNVKSAQLPEEFRKAKVITNTQRHSSSGASAVPTLSEWALILLSLLVLGAGFSAMPGGLRSPRGK